MLGVNTIESCPATFALFLSSVKSKSPCKIPLIPNEGRYLSAVFNLSANCPPWFLSISELV